MGYYQTISKETITANWALILKYSKDGCFGYNCPECPFEITSSECGLYNQSFESPLLVEHEVQNVCIEIINNRLHEIMEQK